jgi:hypothetical protein
MTSAFSVNVVAVPRVTRHNRVRSITSAIVNSDDAHD